MFSFRVFRLGLLRARGFEGQRPYPGVCCLVALGLPFWGALFGLKSQIVRGGLLRLGCLLAEGKCPAGRISEVIRSGFAEGRCPTHPLVAGSQR